MEKENKKVKYVEWALAFIILVFCECFFFRNVIGTRAGALIGGRVDGRLTTLLTEHWWNFFTGKENFSEIAMFYPVEDVIGYTDLFLGYGLIYSIFRLFGINMYLAYKWTLLLVHFMGTTTMFYLLKRKMNCSFFWSLFGTMAFSFSNTYARRIGHTQLVAISTLPLLLILFIGFIKYFENRKRRNIYAYLFIAWFVLLTYNSWYVACFTGIFCLVFLIVYFIRLKSDHVRVVPILKGRLAYIWKDIIGYLVFMIVLYIPFIQIYLPVFKTSSGYSYATCVTFLPEFADIINVTEENFMLGKLMGKLGLSSRGYSGEVAQGFSIILLGLFVVLMFMNKRRQQSDIANDIVAAKTVQYNKILIDTVFITVVVCLALIMRLSSNGVSLWAIVYYLVPVVRSMRAVARFMLWLSFPMAIITAYTANKYISVKGIGNLLISIFASVLLFISNINTTGVYNAWNLPDELNFITNVSEPPEDAEVFYIIDTENIGDSESIYQMDAFEIATWYSLKTINGYSGRTPNGWSGIWDVCSDNYEENVYYWIEEYGLINVYAYDRATNAWIAFEDRTPILMDDVFSPIEN